MRRSRYLACVLLAVLCGCATPRTQLLRPFPVGPSAETPDIRVATFNAGLAPGITSLYSRRLQPISEALSRLDADVICLQEVWTDEARQAAIEGLGLPPENVFYADTAGENETGQDVCTADEIAGALSCAKEKCVGEPAEELGICAYDKCRWPATWLYLRSRSCLNCLAASAGLPADQVYAQCVSKGGASRLYGGRNGVILASRWPLQDREALRLPSSAANRVALLARVKPPGLPAVEVACTHLSAKNRVSPTDPRFDDWEDEMSAQLSQISTRLAARGGRRPQMLIGDLNFGQRHDPDVSAVAWPVWKTAADLGLASPAEYAEPPVCSWCRGNRLNGAGHDCLIDHVLVRRSQVGVRLAPIGVRQIFNQPIRVRGWRGEAIETNLSDHYGIEVDFRLR